MRSSSTGSSRSRWKAPSARRTVTDTLTHAKIDRSAIDRLSKSEPAWLAEARRAAFARYEALPQPGEPHPAGAGSRSKASICMPRRLCRRSSSCGHPKPIAQAALWSARCATRSPLTAMCCARRSRRRMRANRSGATRRSPKRSGTAGRLCSRLPAFRQARPSISTSARAPIIGSSSWRAKTPSSPWWRPIARQTV